MTDTMVLCSSWFIQSDVLIYFGFVKRRPTLVPEAALSRLKFLLLMNTQTLKKICKRVSRKLIRQKKMRC